MNERVTRLILIIFSFIYSNALDITEPDVFIEQSICLNRYSGLRKLSLPYDAENACLEYCKHFECNVKIICKNNNWIYYSGKCYKEFNDIRLNWLDSLRKCQTYNSTLITIKNELMLNFISILVNNTSSVDEEYFIGLNRDVDYQKMWKWSSGENLTYSNWIENIQNNERCVEIILAKYSQFYGKWNAVNCNKQTRKFICELKSNSILETNDDLMFLEYLKYYEIDEINIYKVVKALYMFSTNTHLSVVTSRHIEIISVILRRISVLKTIPSNTILDLTKFIDRLLDAANLCYQKYSIPILTAIENILRKIDLKDYNVNREYKVQLKNIGITVKDYTMFSNTMRTDDGSLESQLTDNDEDTASVSIQMSFIEKPLRRLRSADDIDYSKIEADFRMSIIYYKSNNLLEISSFYNSSIKGTIVSASVNTFEQSNIEKKSNKVDYSIKYNGHNNKTGKCVYLDIVNDTYAFWSDTGCEYLYYQNGYHKCQCNHTTHFALLFSPDNDLEKDSTIEYIILTCVSYIGLTLSLLGLSITLITYAVFSQLRQGDVHKCLIMLSICLFISNICFLLLTLVKPKVNLFMCLTLAISLHYFILASFMWMLMIAFVQYLNFVKILVYIENFMFKACLASFGIPFIIPLTLVIIDINRFYNANAHIHSICWLNTDALITAFIIPVVVISLTNFAIFIKIIFHLLKANQFSTKNKTLRRQNQIGAAICTFVLMGTTWIYGLTICFNYNYKFINEFIFCILNTSQGFVIFLFHVLLSRVKRDLWRNLFTKITGASTSKKGSQPIISKTSNTSVYSKSSF